MIFPEWYDQLKKEIKKYDVISFDVFDTLIKRNCAASQLIYKIVEYKLKENGENIDAFSEKRFSAEIKLYKQKKIPTLSEIYDNMNLSQDEKNKALEIEQKIELSICCQNPLLFDIYQECLKSGKKIIAISDMYLSSTAIIKMLNKCGYTQFDKIWVSSEYRATKASGKLFETVIKELNILPNEIFHIGDNRIADILGAKKCGIKAFKIPSQIINTSYFKVPNNKKSYESKFLYPFINNTLPLIDNRISQIGFETLGPMVYGFCQWLYKMKKEYQFEKLLFCARDVQQTMDIFKLMYPQEAENVEYMCVSLKSLEKPYAAACGKDTSQEAMEQLRLIRIYFRQLGCNKRVAMVDSGCGGHTQNMISTILGVNSDFHGLYMRVSKNFRKNIKDKESFPFMFTQKPSAKSYISGAFFETMLSATHGRTLRYAYDNSKNIVVPVFGEDNPQSNIILEFQKGIFLFYQYWSSTCFRYHQIKSCHVENAFLNLSFFPRKEDVELLANITGGNESYFAIVQNKNSTHLFSKSFFLELKDTYWKGGYLCKITSAYKLICKIYLFLDEIILNWIGF